MWGSGESHKEMRNFTIRTLRTFGFGELKTAEEFLQNELREMSKSLDKKIVEQEEDIIYFHNFFKVPTFNFVWRIMAGSRCSYDDSKIQRLIAAVGDIFSINIGVDVEWQVPILRYIPGFSQIRAKKDSFDACFNFFRVSLNLKNFQFANFK